MASIANTESARKRISALAQLVRILMRDGITTTSALMEETGYSERAIWSAKGELRRSAAECRVQPSAVQPAAVEVQPSAVDGAAECRVHKERVSPHTPLPKEILPAAACKQAEKGEIEGLNGSTPKMVRLFAELIAGPLGTPDEITAHDLLASNVEFYGAERVKVGFLEFRQKMAAEKHVRDPLRLFNGFVKGAKLVAATDRPVESEYERKARLDGGRFVRRADGKLGYEFGEASA